MATTELHLGYEVGTGKPVSIPLRHMVVAGMTQEAGKTTCLEGLIDRSGLRALAFVTKRGERSFISAERIRPYFRERADWQFVASVLESTMREKMKFERSWIMRASKGAKTLADVHRNVKEFGAKTKSGFAADMYNMLDEYLQIVVPRIATVHFSTFMALEPGINACDVSDPSTFPSELQALVMRSMMEVVHEQYEKVVTIVPEAWEFIPQGRGSPVKLTAEQLVRKGAGLGNYVWIDSQDIAGVDKMMLRACPVWLLGVQRESNEIKRTLENIPAGVKRPKPEQIATLTKGQFFACFGTHVIKTYAQPYWMTETEAIAVAKGRLDVEIFAAPKPKQSEDSMVATNDTMLEILKELKTQNQNVAAIATRIAVLERPVPSGIVNRPASVDNQAAAAPLTRLPQQGSATTPGNAAAELQMIYEYVLDRLRREDPATLIELMQSRPEIVVKTKRTTLQLDETTSQGMIAILIKEGFFATTATANSAWSEAKERWGYKGAAARFYEAARALVKRGFLREKGDGGFTSTGARVRVEEE